jgi:ribonucleotide reductase beta subunit family protein with ferritin-like domain
MRRRAAPFVECVRPAWRVSIRFRRVVVDQEAWRIEELAADARPFRALYEHWERHQWSPFAIDFSADAASFAALDEKTRLALVWVFAHRFQAEFNVAALLAPFLLAAPDYEVQLLLATQVADEHRHIESVLRVYSEVFGVEGGIGAVKALADEQLDPVAGALYTALEDVVRLLETSRDEDSFLRAVIAYHVFAEGSIGRANQTFVAAQFDRVGAFPGLREAQRLAVRDEVRHIGIGVCYARRRLARDGASVRALIAEMVEGFQALGQSLLASAAADVSDHFVDSYGAEPATLWAEVEHQLRLRLRSIGLDATGRILSVTPATSR